MTDDHAATLRKAAADYRKAKRRAEQLMESARDGLHEAVRAAYAAGMRKADIIRATEHVWSRTWVDEAVRDLERGEAE